MHTQETLPEEEERQSITREIEIDAPLEEVWDALSTEAGRDRWLEPDPERVLIVDREEPPTEISWWWWSEDSPATHVEIEVVAIPTGARVIVTEINPPRLSTGNSPARLPLARMAMALRRGLVCA